LLSQHLDKEKFEIKYLYTGKTGLLLKDLFYPFLILTQLRSLKKVLKDFRPEVVHINPSLTNTSIIRDFLFLKFIKKEGCPVLFFIHGWRENVSNKFQYIFWKNFFKKRLEIADAIVVLAYQFKRKLVDLGINANKIYISSTMVESEKYLPDSKIFTRPYNILFCANIKKEKGPFEILKAVPMVLVKFPNTKFIFIGTGRDLKELKEKSKEMGIEKNVVFTGYMAGEEKIEIFKNAHIFAYPSYTEGFPTVILEAMAAGVVPIFTPVGGLVYALVDGKNGYVINSMPPKPEEISEKIIKLIENQKLMKNMSKNNLKKAKEKYDVRVVSKQIEEIYQDIIT
jgi:glycosyltransferase involved in cell wall biosynthesis